MFSDNKALLNHKGFDHRFEIAPYRRSVICSSTYVSLMISNIKKEPVSSWLNNIHQKRNQTYNRTIKIWFGTRTQFLALYDICNIHTYNELNEVELGFYMNENMFVDKEMNNLMKEQMRRFVSGKLNYDIQLINVEPEEWSCLCVQIFI